ncbi:MAG TPA: hypothetical protein VFE98_10660 [Candidatus Bathyarchaeia archaeon]|nr:hypothetical protein [Candidatus Bathyarchaeia archaeon]
MRRSKAPLEGWMLPVKYVCTKCNYSGFLAMENDPVEEQDGEK